MSTKKDAFLLMAGVLLGEVRCVGWRDGMQRGLGLPFVQLFSLEAFDHKCDV